MAVTSARRDKDFLAYRHLPPLTAIAATSSHSRHRPPPLGGRRLGGDVNAEDGVQTSEPLLLCRELTPEDVDAERRAVLDAAQSLGFPSLPLRQGAAVAAGEEAWRRFVTTAHADDLAAARAALDLDRERA